MKTTKSPIVLLFKSSLFELSNDMMNGVYDYARQHGWQMQLIEPKFGSWMTRIAV